MSPWLRQLIVVLCLCTCGIAVWAGEAARPFVHPLFSDNMVLQRNQTVTIWGWTKPGATVRVVLGDTRAEGRAAHDGRWQVQMGPFTAGGPYDLAIDGPQKVAFSNVMIGEVWLCSGQSNMEMGVGLAQNGDQEIAQANHPNIRLFRVPGRVALTRQESFTGAAWEVCSPDTVGKGGWNGFSATAYFFARHLEQTLHVPIGVIQATWGGTEAEDWASAAGLRGFPEFSPILSRLQRAANGKEQEPADYQKTLTHWWATNDPAQAAWAAPTLPEKGWTPMTVPLPATLPGLPDGPGIGWFRFTLDVPDTWDGKEIRLHLGEFDISDTTFFNGTQIGGIVQWNCPRDYTVPGNLVHAGKNTIAVRVFDQGGGGREFRSPLAPSAWLASDEKQSVSLLGTWLYRKSAPLDRVSLFPLQFTVPNHPSVLYNGMIAPLTGVHLAGVIWYQGESNTGRARQYRRLLPALIADWRQQFTQPTLPFLLVQISGFLDPTPQPADSTWAELREAQALTEATVPHTAMVVTTDIGDRDIHPKNKQEVGRRLGLAAQAVVYGYPIIYSGPRYAGMQIEGATIRLFFNHAETGLLTTQLPLTGFAIAAANHKFVWATAQIQGKTVVVSSPEILHPVAVRYAWAEFPQATLTDGTGLPVSSFRTAW